MVNNYDSIKAKKFFDIFGTDFDCSVLDIGCNGGFIGSEFKAKEYLGLVIDEHALENARSMGLAAEYFDANKDDIPEYDLVLCLDLLEHLVDPLDFLRRLSLSVKKRLIISIPNDYTLFNFLRMIVFNRPIKSTTDIGNPIGHLQFFTIKNSIDIVSRYFNISKVHYLSNGHYHSNKLNKPLSFISHRLFSTNIIKKSFKYFLIF